MDIMYDIENNRSVNDNESEFLSNDSRNCQFPSKKLMTKKNSHKNKKNVKCPVNKVNKQVLEKKCGAINSTKCCGKYMYHTHIHNRHLLIVVFILGIFIG